jgi:enoyl-CoA hydratase/carnithine racemase
MFTLRIDGVIARLTLSRPEARNAIPLSGWDELAARVGEAEQSGARVLVLSGEARGAFCAGADIGDFDRFQEDVEARSEFRLAIRRGLERIRDLALPTIAVIEGDCYGAGVALAMACDVRLAGGGAQFAITPAKLGLSYPQEDVHRLVSLVGAGQAARLLLGAGTIDGTEAARIGLVEMYYKNGVHDLVAHWAEAMAVNEPDSLRVLKRGIALVAEGIRQNEQQDRDFDALLGAAATAERVAAHRNRRR